MAQETGGTKGRTKEAVTVNQLLAVQELLTGATPLERKRSCQGLRGDSKKPKTHWGTFSRFSHCLVDADSASSPALCARVAPKPDEMATRNTTYRETNNVAEGIAEVLSEPARDEIEGPTEHPACPGTAGRAGMLTNYPVSDVTSLIADINLANQALRCDHDHADSRQNVHADRGGQHDRRRHGAADHRGQKSDHRR